MVSPTPLTGTDLIDCAKANAKQGKVVAARQCGYGDDLDRFENALFSACQDIGIDIEQLSDLITDRQQPPANRGIEVGPNTPSDL